VHRPDVSLKLAGALGEATMSEAVYNPILDLLADHTPRTLQQIEVGVKDKNISFAQLMQAVLALLGAGHLAPVQEDMHISKAKSHTHKINQHLISKARASGEISYLVSPVTGGGMMVSRFAQLFLLARLQGKKRPDEWAQFVWEILAMQGQRLTKEGAIIDSADENIAELSSQAQQFQQKQLAILEALQIA